MPHISPGYEIRDGISTPNLLICGSKSSISNWSKLKAKTFISVPQNDWSGDAKIVIVWEEPHKIYKQFFTT